MLKRFLTLTLIVSMILIPTFTCAAAESIDVLTEISDIVRRRVNNMALYPDATNRMNYDTDGYVYDRIYVKKGLISGCIDLMDVYDFEAERPGMKPDEGDYMFHQFRNRIQRVFDYEYPSRIDYYDYAGTTYEVYEIYLPVITTRSEEDDYGQRRLKIRPSPHSSC